MNREGEQLVSSDAHDPGCRQTILLVDDDAEQLELYAIALDGAFHTVTAARGDTALERVASTAPDLVVLDGMMPELDGWEVCRRIKANAKTRRLPVVMVTVTARHDTRERARDAGATTVLTKPCLPDELLRTITDILADPIGTSDGRRINIEASTTSSARVLIADDDDRVRAFVERTLREASYRTTAVADGAESLHVATRLGPFESDHRGRPHAQSGRLAGRAAAAPKRPADESALPHRSQRPIVRRRPASMEARGLSRQAVHAVQPA
jgi:two-component system cell cycle response regulator DivK